MKLATIAAVSALALTAACATTPGMVDDAALDGPVTFGGFIGPESAVYDAARDRYLVTNVGQFGPGNDGYISAINPDGSVIERMWIAGGDDQALSNPLGSAIFGGSLYVADGPNVRLFDLETGAQTSVLTVEGSSGFNDLAIAEDGTVYATQTGTEDASTWAIYRITSEGSASVFAEGEALGRPNGIEMDGDGNIVTVGLGSTTLTVFNPGGDIVDTIELPVAGNDGLIVMDDGYIVSSVFTGAIVWAGKDGATEMLAEGVQSAASITLDPTRNRVVIPQLLVQSLTLLDL